MVSLEQELAAATDAVRAAGDEAARMRTAGLRFGHKHGFELVTEADLRVAEMLHSALADGFPGTGWLSEEHTDSSARLRSDRVWIVDPIDGTREYLEGVPEYAISVGLVVLGRPALGVVYNPATHEMFAAVCGDDVPAAAGLLPPHFEVLVGRGEKRTDDVPVLPRGARTRGVGSVAYRLALLSVGKADAMITATSRSEWDVAAGVALCLANGIRVTDVVGRALRFNQPDVYVPGVVAARPGLHGHLADTLRRYRY